MSDHMRFPQKKTGGQGGVNTHVQSQAQMRYGEKVLFLFLKIIGFPFALRGQGYKAEGIQ